MRGTASTNADHSCFVQAWHGEAGSLVAQSSTMVKLCFCDWHNKCCKHPAWMVWKKALSDGSAAVLLMNNDEKAADVSVDLAQLRLKCAGGSPSYEIRSLYEGNKSLGTFTGKFTAAALPSHDSAFVVASCAPGGSATPTRSAAKRPDVLLLC